MIRIVASLKSKLWPAHEIIRITESDLRDKVQRQLNKGEHRDALVRWIFFANPGKFQVGD